MAKSVLITGTSSGIGHALAREFKSKGYRVFSTARSTSSIDDLAALGIETLPLEATSRESIAKLKAEINQRTNGRLDYLINNAGRNCTIPALEASDAEIEATFAVNVFAVMAICREFAPLLLPTKGTIVQIGSLAGVMPYAFSSVYCASKAALHAYTDTLRIELAPFGVKVITIMTGGVKSNIARTERQLLPNSLYSPIQADYERRLVHSQSEGVPAEVYARRVIAQVEGGGKKVVWEGGKSWLVWFVTGYLPRWVIERAMMRMFGLERLGGIVAGREGGRGKVE